jgi:hypothetical protein
MKYNYIIFVCILSCLCYSCRNTLVVNGTYIGKQNPHFLTLLEDSTFKYEYRAMWYSESSGTWQKRGNTIYLNSFEQKNEMPIDYETMENNQKEVIINIKINASDKPAEDYICFSYVNGNSVFLEPEKGSYSFDCYVPVDSIYFLIAKRPFVLRGTGYKMSYNDIKTKTLYPHLSVGESMNVTINIIDYLFGYTVFKDKKLESKGEKLIFKDGNKSYKLSLK